MRTPRTHNGANAPWLSSDDGAGRAGLGRRVRRIGLVTRYLVSMFSITLFVLVAVPLVTKEPATPPALTTPAAQGPAAQGPAPKALPEPAPPRPDRFYRWRDARGHVHFSTTRPPSSVAVEEVPFKRRAAVPAPVHDPGTLTPAPRPDLNWKGLLSVYTPEGMAELKEAVEQTARRLDERNQRLDSLQEMLQGR